MPHQTTVVEVVDRVHEKNISNCQLAFARFWMKERCLYHSVPTRDLKMDRSWATATDQYYLGVATPDSHLPETKPWWKQTCHIPYRVRALLTSKRKYAVQQYVESNNTAHVCPFRWLYFSCVTLFLPHLAVFRRQVVFVRHGNHGLS